MQERACGPCGHVILVGWHHCCSCSGITGQRHVGHAAASTEVLSGVAGDAVPSGCGHLGTPARACAMLPIHRHHHCQFCTRCRTRSKAILDLSLGGLYNILSLVCFDSPGVQFLCRFAVC